MLDLVFQGGKAEDAPDARRGAVAKAKAPEPVLMEEEDGAEDVVAPAGPKVVVSETTSTASTEGESSGTLRQHQANKQQKKRKLPESVSFETVGFSFKQKRS